jgi:signal transduction histidine kinase
VGIVRFLRAHLDSVLALLLTAAYVGQVYLAEVEFLGGSFVDGLELDETTAIVASVAFLLSLAVRRRLPLLPLGLAFAALVLTGQGSLDAIASLLLGVMLMAYSVGAWAGGRSGQVGALGVGALAGLSVVRAAGGTLEPRDLAAPVALLVGAWLTGLVVRSFRAARGDPRVLGPVDWESGTDDPDAAGRDDAVRELRDIIERAMSAVVLQARNAGDHLDDDPADARRSLSIIEAAGTEALEETQRLTAELLSPAGARSLEPAPGLANLDLLAERVSAAGLPVDMRVQGRPLPLTPDLDGVAYRVVQEALMTTLEHAQGATASVVVRYERDELQIEVVDDGVGISDDDADAQVAGLLAVREEVASLGGTLDAGPADDGGYWVLARLPYEPAWD